MTRQPRLRVGFRALLAITLGGTLVVLILRAVLAGLAKLSAARHAGPFVYAAALLLIVLIPVGLTLLLAAGRGSATKVRRMTQ